MLKPQTKDLNLLHKLSQIYKKVLVGSIILATIASIAVNLNILNKNSKSSIYTSAAPVCPSGYNFNPGTVSCEIRTGLSGYSCFDWMLPDSSNNCQYGSLPLFDCLANIPTQTEIYYSDGAGSQHACTKTPYYYNYAECTINPALFPSGYSPQQNARILQDTMNYSSDTFAGATGVYRSDNFCNNNTNGCTPGLRPFLLAARHYHSIGGQYVGFQCINKAWQNGSYYHSQPIPIFIQYGDMSGSYGSCNSTYPQVLTVFTNSSGAETMRVCGPTNYVYAASLPRCDNGFQTDYINLQCYNSTQPIGFDCPAGQYLQGVTQCTTYEAGNYCPGGVNPNKIECPANSYCLSGSSGATPCPANTISPAGSTSASACTTTTVKLNIKAFLSGPFNDATDNMNNQLRTLNKIPTLQPFNDSNFGWQGTESLPTSNLSPDICDWILVTVRDPYSNVFITGRAAMLKKDGTIIDAENASTSNTNTGVTLFGVPANGNYKVVLQHRNHLAIATNNPIAFALGGQVNMDFTTNSNVKNSNQAQAGTTSSGTPIYGMRKGNSNRDGAIDATDRTSTLNARELSGVYDDKDLNMDGDLDASDRAVVQNSPEAVQDISFTIALPVIPGTSQNNCYNNTEQITCPVSGQTFYGQDAQQISNVQSFTANSNGTVYDNITGLTWVKAPDTDVTWDEAKTKASQLVYGGYDDWRVPTIKELYSLINFNGIFPGPTSSAGAKPFIDSSTFTFNYKPDNPNATPDNRWIDVQEWSSTKYVSTTMGTDETIFGVNFADGRIKGYPQYQPGSNNTTARKMNVRYVRGTGYDLGTQNSLTAGNTSTQGTLPHFSLSQSGLSVVDNHSKLMWQQVDDGVTRKWQQSLDYCENLNFDGYTDWRLPNAKELQNLVDYSKSPAINGKGAINSIFNLSNQESYFWSATTILDGLTNSTQKPSTAIYIAFGRALGWVAPPNGGAKSLIDVHGAGAQRSDPKDGNPSDFPSGFGPQGDDIRILNYVRCVRNIQ